MINKKKTALKIGAVAAAVTIAETRTRTKDELQRLAQSLDVSRFGGWFAANGISYESIAAMWLTESLGNPRAVNLTGGDGAQGGAWGLGQVTARTAGDYGVLQPLAFIMLYPRIGGRISMEHVRFTITALRSKGFQSSDIEWVQAYNVGVTGYANGNRNEAHYARFLTHLTTGVFL